VVAVSNSSGGSDGTTRFDAWGNSLASTGATPLYGYAGREPDETGLIYCRARYYDPAVGRFTQRDPIGLRGGINQFAYVGGNPVNRVDPSGTIYRPIVPNAATAQIGYTGQTAGGLSSGTQNLSNAQGLSSLNVDDVSPIADGMGETAAERQSLFHYTNEKGLLAILESGDLWPSLKQNNPKDARYGNGQYLSDIIPGTKSPAYLSQQFLRIPYQGQKYTHYLEIDVTGLNIIAGRPGVFVIPNEDPLDLTDRIISQGVQ
jgi:RHS repeat-associated protein